MSDIDWRGISMALSQLKAIAEPSRLELQEQEYLFRSMEKKKDRQFKNSEVLFKQLNDDHSANQRLLLQKQNEITNMNADAENLLKEKFTNTTGNLYDAFKELDLSVVDGLNKANDMIEDKVSNQLTSLTQLSGLYSNMTFGKQLRESEGAIKNTYIMDDAGNAILDQDKYVLDADNNPTDELNPNYGKPLQYGWDLDENGFTNPEELNAGLNQTIKWLEANGQDVQGIKEGYWSGYQGDSERNKAETSFEVNELNYYDKKQDVLNGGYISEEGSTLYKQELKLLQESGYSLDFSKFVASEDSGGADEYVEAMQYKRLAKELNDYKNGEGTMYDFVASQFGVKSIDDGRGGKSIGNLDGTKLGNSTEDKDKITRVNDFVAGRTKELGDILDKLVMNDAKHYIVDLPSYESVSGFEETALTNFRTAGEEDVIHSENHLNKWDSMIEFGFTEKFYKDIMEKSYVNNPQKDVYLGFMLKKEFEFLFDNIDAYTKGTLPQNHKERFDSALIGFNQRFPEHFKERAASVMDIIKEKSPTVYGTITQ